jgi:hypothetical protein
MTLNGKKQFFSSYIGGLLIVYPSSGSLAAMVASHGTGTSKF